MKKLLVILLASVFTACAAEKASVEQCEKLITEKVQVLDVRTEEEWNAGHLDGAVRVDYRSDDFKEAVGKAVDLKKPVLVYCHSGGRSANAAMVLEKLGCETVYDMKGGITAWKKAEKKVVK